jgi:DNA-binding protein HU-beta
VKPPPVGGFRVPPASIWRYAKRQKSKFDETGFSAFGRVPINLRSAISLFCHSGTFRRFSGIRIREQSRFHPSLTEEEYFARRPVSGESCKPKGVIVQMNKGELVDVVAARADVTKKQADAVLSAALDSIMDSVSRQEKVTLVGFGSFEARERKAREGRNPKTGEKMDIPATRVPAFSAGKMFKDKVAE